MTPTVERAIAQHRGGDLAAAESSYLEALAWSPLDVDALHFLGVLRMQQHRHEEAAGLIGKAVEIEPRQPGALSNLGLALRGAGRLDGALSSFDRALALRPAFPEALNNRGNVLLGLGRPAEALASFDRALALRPDYAEAHNNRGNALRAQMRPGAAMDSYDRALVLSPDYADAVNNRGMALRDLGRPQDALADFDRALALAPSHVDALDNRGIVLADLGQPAAALASFDRALALAPDRPASHFNASLSSLALGDFERGWREHEWRWRDAQMKHAQRGFTQPLLLDSTQDVAGRTILLHAEQGYGDAIQFARYARAVAALGATVLVEVPSALSSLFESLAGASRIIEAGAPLPPFDLHCPLMSLPLAFRTTLASIPDETPYLAAEPTRVREWRDLLGERSRARIGVAWSGRAAHVNDRNRSIALADILPLLEANAEFVSLQKDVRDSDRPACAARPDLRDVGTGLADFADTAALIAQLDLVITVDTSVAHLAGALGKPVWILLPFAADWRWLRDREDSPWYPTATLFRQPVIGDWRSVVRRVAAALALRQHSPQGSGSAGV